MSRKLIVLYYAATALFLLLDYGLGVNVRIAFLDGIPALRPVYYGVCFACLGLALWRPAWTTVIGSVESLATLVALIINMGTRAILTTDLMLETGTGFVTMAEIINFLIAGAAAYVSFAHGLQRLHER